MKRPQTTPTCPNLRALKPLRVPEPLRAQYGVVRIEPHANGVAVLVYEDHTRVTILTCGVAVTIPNLSRLLLPKTERLTKDSLPTDTDTSYYLSRVGMETRTTRRLAAVEAQALGIGI